MRCGALGPGLTREPSSTSIPPNSYANTWNSRHRPPACKIRAICRIPSPTWACALMESSTIGSRRILLWSGLVVSRGGAAERRTFWTWRRQPSGESSCRLPAGAEIPAAAEPKDQQEDPRQEHQADGEANPVAKGLGQVVEHYDRDDEAHDRDDVQD